MRKIFNYLSLVVIVMMAFHCNDECQPQTFTIQHLSDFNCTLNERQLDASGLNIDSYIVIRDQITFDSLVNCQVTGLNFSDHDLIIGKKGLTSGLDYIEYEYSDDCSKNVLLVEMTRNATSEAPIISYHAIVPKITDLGTLDVDIVVK